MDGDNGVRKSLELHLGGGGGVDTFNTVSGSSLR